MTVKVLGVKLANINSKGTFTIPSEKTVANTLLPYANWALSSESSDITSYASMGSKADAAKTLNGAFQQLNFGSDNNFIVLPQQLTAFENNTAENKSYIGLYVQISNGAELIYPKNPDSKAYAFVAIPINDKWEPGKKYTYQISFGGTDGTGGAGLVPENQIIPGKDDNAPNTPGTQPENSITDTNPKDGGNDDIGEQVLGKPITFTVTVEDWVNQNVDKSLSNN